MSKLVFSHDFTKMRELVWWNKDFDFGVDSSWFIPESVLSEEKFVILIKLSF